MQNINFVVAFHFGALLNFYKALPIHYDEALKYYVEALMHYEATLYHYVGVDASILL